MQNAYLPLFVFLISCSTLVHAEPALICGGPKPPCALGTATICGGPKPPCELFTGTIISCGFLPDLDFNCSAAADAVVNFSDKDPSEGHNATEIAARCSAACGDLESAGAQCGDPGKENAGQEKKLLCKEPALP